MIEDFFKLSLYALTKNEKDALLLQELNALTKFHAEHCQKYAKILKLFYGMREISSELSKVPYFPVNLFKTQKLMSFPEDKTFKILQSSGTTAFLPSKIYLDAETAILQTRALSSIMISFLGHKRLPMIVLDHPNVISNRLHYNARGAAIVGMLSFGRDPVYVMDENMKLNKALLQEWLKKYEDTPVLLFGLTYVVWKHFLSELKKNEISIPKGILLHTGGWKKLQDAQVTNEDFKKKLQETTSISECYNFYGMVEQIGTVFVECEKGHWHCPNFADVIIRDPRTWQECPIGKTGVIQVLSILPRSYPGHSLLTEDLGEQIGVDDCGCKRMGKYFKILGRVPKAEIRGCSDTIVTADQKVLA